MRAAFASLLALALAACAVQPPQPQLPPTPEGFTTPGLEGVHFTGGIHAPEPWWYLFRSPALNALVQQALDGSPTLARAQGKLREAEATLEARTGATRYPRIDAKLSANRIDVQPEALGVPALPVPMPFNLYLASVGVSYDLDLAGAHRNELRALQSEVDHQRFQLEAARAMLAGNVVTAAIREAALRAQIAQTEELLALQAKQLAITEKLQAIGTAAPADVAAARSTLAQARAGLPELRRQLEQVRHRLAVYLGQPPAAAQDTRIRLVDLYLPGALPAVMPSELARRRPDIAAAEALLYAAAARVGVAQANFYPQISLTATAGTLASQAGDLFGPGSAFYLLGASLTQPLFRGGELKARKRAADAAYEQAGAAYREVVLQGFQEVADAMRALEADARKLREHAEATDQARIAQGIADARFQAGGLSEYALLGSRRKLEEARLQLTQASADRAADTAALLQALGGGWWVPGEPPR